MHVAFDGRSLSSPVLRGWDRYTVGLVKELVRLGVEVTLLHRQKEPLRQEHIEGLGCKILGLSDIRGLHYEQVVVPRALRQNKVDIFHAPRECGVPLFSPCPVVMTYHSVTAHSYLDLVKRGLLKGPVRNYLGYDVNPNAWNYPSLYWRLQLKRVNHFFTPSIFCREEIEKFLSIRQDKITVTHLALPEQFECRSVSK